MKYCRNCHVVYSSFAAACPKCGVPAEQKQEPPSQEAGGSARPFKDWLWLIIGIPAFIAAIYFLVKLLARLG